MRTVEDLTLPISKDISSVIEPQKFDDSVLSPILDFIPGWLERIKIQFNKPVMKYHFSCKNGPNGHALHRSDLDISAVINDPLIYKAIRDVEGALGDYSPMEVYGINPDPTYIHSRLNQISDKAGKTRTIAIIDYYSQRCLKPLHDFLMKTLRSLVSDGTYSHQNVGKYAQQTTLEKGYIYCADLTTFTDRFPREIQRVLLKEIVKEDVLSDAWWTLLAERTFKLQWSDERVTYACGQPMGAYGSWALCSLAHHLVVEYCGYLAGVKDIKTKYRLIGDDVIITDRGTAENYQKLILALGVEINFGKTVQSAEASEFSGAEVAKQLYLNGTCLTPITPGFIRDLKKPYMFNTCLSTLKYRYEFFSSDLPILLAKSFYRYGKATKLAWLVASNPTGGVIKPDFSGFEDNSPWVSVEYDRFVTELSMTVIDRFNMKCYQNSEASMKFMMSGRSPWEDSARIEPRCIKHVSRDLQAALYDFTEKLDQLFYNPDDLEAIAIGLDFIPDPYLPYRQKKETRQRRISLILQEVYNRVQIQKEEETPIKIIGWNY